MGCDASGDIRIHAITHALAWYHSEAASGPINVFIGLSAPGADVPVPQEHLDALDTVATAWCGDPPIRLWQLAGDGELVEFAARPARFTTATPAHWAQLLANVANAPIIGMAGELGTAVRLPSFALYPKLTGGAIHPWKMRLDGLNIGLTGPSSTSLKFGGNLGANGGPQAALEDGRRATTTHLRC